jgi:thymidylate kinase
MRAAFEAALAAHSSAYPLLQPQDVFKFLYQSSFGCEHLAPAPEAAIEGIRRELAAAAERTAPHEEALAGSFFRWHLKGAGEGLFPETLGRLFCLSATSVPDGEARLAVGIEAATALTERGVLPFTKEAFAEALLEWQRAGCGALHHSEAFRAAYHPAYRVISTRYAPFLPLLAKIDAALAVKERVILAVEGGSAAGKSTLGALLSDLYGCTLLHMDDFFLQPAQRTAERLCEVGGNVDRERFFEEVLKPLSEGRSVQYRRFDCSTCSLQPAVEVTPAQLVVVEGAYSMHPLLAPYYDLSAFLSVPPALQRQRILRRNTPALAARFFAEWIPMEMRYFEKTAAAERCTVQIDVSKTEEYTETV